MGLCMGSGFQALGVSVKGHNVTNYDYQDHEQHPQFRTPQAKKA